MKYYLPFISMLLLISTAGYAQKMSKSDFNEKLLTQLNQKYNITAVPTGYYNCNYQLFTENPDGFFSKKDFPLQCLKKYYLGFEYSDNGDKMREVAFNNFIEPCKRNNAPYKTMLDVPGYCKCLVKQYRKNDIKFTTFINPNFVRSKQYQKMTAYCVRMNKK